MNNREIIRNARANAAVEFATRCDWSITAEQARKLLHRCELYALKAARYWEEEQDPRHYTSSGEPKRHFAHEGELLEARRERLERELQDVSGQPLEMHNYGLYPDICYRDNGLLRPLNLLYWFD